MLIKKNKIPFVSMIFVGILPSFIKVFLYKIKGYKIGKNVKIGFGSVIISKKVNILEGTKIGLFSVIKSRDLFLSQHVTIGSFTFIDTINISIEKETRINEKVIIGGIQTPDSLLQVGERCIIMEYSYINTTCPIIIGNDCGIGGHCLLFTHGSWLNQLDGFPVSFAPITLGNRVWLPWRVFIMPGVELGNDVIVGANSMVNKSFSSNCMIAGSPATIIKENIPAKLNNSQKNQIFNQILEDFIKHLNFHHYKTIKLNVNEYYSKDGNFKIILLDDEKIEFNHLNLDILYLAKIDHSNIDGFNYTKGKRNMFIDLDKKLKYGKNKIGEEFYKFISRYGIRF